MRYYSTQRPVGPGTFPKPADNKVLGLRNFDKRIFCEQVGRKAWGYIDYEKPLTFKQAAAYELVPPADMEGIVKILMERDGVSRKEAQQMIEECRQRLQDEAVPTGDIGLAEEILAEELGLEPDYLMDLLF